jgi:hypothetical protein
MLTKREISIASRIRKMDIKVFEAFPGAFYDVLGAKRKSIRSIKSLFKKERVLLDFRRHTQDELDSIACATSAWMLFESRAELIGKRGQIILPKRY